MHDTYRFLPNFHFIAPRLPYDIMASEYTDWNLVMIFNMISTMFTSVKMVKVYMVTLMLLRRILPKCTYILGCDENSGFSH